jgi:hypothetical protein
VLTFPNRFDLVRRVVWEASAVQAAFPRRFRLVMDDQGALAWEGAVPVEGRDFPVIISYPLAYPAQPPRLETTAELSPRSPHVLGRVDHRTQLCWLAPKAAAPHRRWQPARHTAATAMHAAQRWALAYLVWQSLGTWPVPDAWDTP